MSKVNLIDDAIISFIKENPGSSVKTSALNDIFQNATKGSVINVDRRLSRRLAYLHKKGKINRKKVSIGPGHDGTRWVYAYD